MLPILLFFSAPIQSLWSLARWYPVPCMEPTCHPGPAVWCWKEGGGDEPLSAYHPIESISLETVMRGCRCSSETPFTDIYLDCSSALNTHLENFLPNLIYLASIAGSDKLIEVLHCWCILIMYLFSFPSIVDLIDSSSDRVVLRLSQDDVLWSVRYCWSLFGWGKCSFLSHLPFLSPQSLFPSHIEPSLDLTISWTFR